MKRFAAIVLLSLAPLLFTGCGTTCAQRGVFWHQGNMAAAKALETYAVPKMGERGPEWLKLTKEALELGKKEYVARCLIKKAEEEGEKPEGEKPEEE